jgi:hypothetical protein
MKYHNSITNQIFNPFNPHPGILTSKIGRQNGNSYNKPSVFYQELCRIL